MVLSLLRSQNRCIERIIALSEAFLEPAGPGPLDALEPFQSGRAAVMRAFELLDRKLTEIASGPERPSPSPSLVSGIETELARRQGLLARLAEVDSQVAERLREAQREVEKELASSRKNRATLGKFKSTGGQASGGGLDTKL